jgi:hypothetical protein
MDDNSSHTGTAMAFPGMGPTRFSNVGKFMLINPFARKLLAATNERLGYWVCVANGGTRAVLFTSVRR